MPPEIQNLLTPPPIPGIPLLEPGEKAVEKFKCLRVTDPGEWNSFNQTSPQGNAFTSTYFLDSLRRPYALFKIIKSNYFKAGLILFPSEENSKRLQFCKWVPHQGILFAPRLRDERESKYLSDQFQLTEFLVRHLCTEFVQISLALFPDNYDIRPFIWHNHHFVTKENKFEIAVKYVKHLKISELRQPNLDEFETKIFKNISQKNRDEIKQSRELNSITQVSGHRDGLQRGLQYLAEPLEDKAIIQNIFESLSPQEKIILFEIQFKGRIQSYAAYLVHRNKATLLFESSPEPLTVFQTSVHWDAFKYLANHGIDIISFTKSSIKGGLVPYYELIWNSKGFN